MTTRKTLPLENLPELIPKDAVVAVGGSWFANHPMAAIRQIVRAGRDDLHAVALLGSIDVDLLIGASTLRELTFSMVSLEAFGLSANLRRAVESGTLPITEIPALSLQVALEAGGHSVPFLPLRGPTGSDLVSMHSEFFGTVRSPFDGTETMVVQALKPDVAIVHALRCDDDGNAQFDGTYGQDVELARSARYVIVTCEEIVPSAVIAANRHMTKIPGLLVDAVVEAPFGAHPCSHVPRYAMDAWTILDYQKAAIAGGADYDELVSVIRGETEHDYRQRLIGDERGAVLESLVSAAEVVEQTTEFA